MAVYTGGYKNDNSVRSLRGAITYAAGTTGAIGTTTLFTVTGDVRIYWIGAKCTTGLTSAGAPTWTLGAVGNTNIWTAPQDEMPDVTGWDVGAWADFNSADYSAGAGVTWLVGLYPITTAISANIVQTIASATITGGVVRWYVMWSPLSGDGDLALHANLSSF